VVTKLWDAWEPDAVVLDRGIPMFADGSKVHPIHHEGKYFKCRGPLNAPRSPQGRVPICQAGGSPRGQRFASRWADTIITEGGGSVDSMKAYRDKVRQQAAEYGRNPDDIKVLFLAHPIIDVTMEAARERTRLEALEAEKHLDLHLSGMSRLTGIDFSKFDLDQPLPSTLTTNGHQSALAKWIGKTPRSILQNYTRKGGIDFTGTADHVAGMMQEIMEEVGGDGFLIFNSYFDRRYVIEVCDGLVPELQRRGVTRKAYAHKHFMDNLRELVPVFLRAAREDLCPCRKKVRFARTMGLGRSRRRRTFP
jgi:alkanesulfonate monooxygenase SsuD/methylene tetrahydromethanopterin reductase-like flavin-dependent oxidoreductase (luciferase family)